MVNRSAFASEPTFWQSNCGFDAVVRVERMWEVGLANGLADPIVSQECEFHQSRYLDPAELDNPGMVIGVDVHAAVRSQQLVKGPRRGVKERLTEQVIEPVEFTNHDPKTAE